MTSRLRLTAAAELDVAEAALWYEKSRKELGSWFLDELDGLLLAIAEAPGHFPPIEPGIRRALMRRFPHGVYFEFEIGQITILAVLHLHRHPDAWMTR